MLEAALCGHPEVKHVSYTPHSHNETHYWLKAACLLTVSSDGFYDSIRPKSYGSRSAIRKSLLGFLQRNVPDFEPRDTDEALVFDGWSALCERFAHPVFFEKSPQHPHHWAALELLMLWIRSTDFQVRVIGLARNPMAVMYSARQLFLTNPTERQFGWAHAYRNILRFGGQLKVEQFCFVRYEDLVNKPVSVFQQLCDFIGIDYFDGIERTLHSKSISLWRQDVSYTLQLDKVVEDLAREMGYSAEDLINPRKPEAAFHVRTIRQMLRESKRRKKEAYNFLKRIMNLTGMSD